MLAAPTVPDPGFGMYHVRLARAQSNLFFLERELDEELPLLIASGEGERLEFKSSLRWDRRENRVNRSLQQVVLKTVAGFLDHEGGTLLTGVGDDGSIIGIEADMQSLKHANRDGFERLLMDLVKDGFGGHECALVHCRFYEVTEKTVCRVIAERKADPVHFVEGGTARLMLRIGNGTRELDVRDAQAHLRNRTPGRA